MGIGTLHSVVIDVADLAVAERFWCEVTSLRVIGSNYAGRFSFLGSGDPPHTEVILQLRDEDKGDEPNRCHVDITPVEGVDAAISKVLSLGGSLRKEPSVYPRPGSSIGRRPIIDWAVMRDPFGNEFCLVADLTAEQSAAAVSAAESGITDDVALRVAAGVTGRMS